MCIAEFCHSFTFPATYENKRISHIVNISNRKCRSRSPSSIFAIMPFDGKCQKIYKRHFTFFIFACTTEENAPVRQKKSSYRILRMTVTFIIGTYITATVTVVAEFLQMNSISLRSPYCT